MEEKKELTLVRGIGVEAQQDALDRASKMPVKGPDVLVCTPSLSGVPCLEYNVALLESVTRCNTQGIGVDCAFVRGDPFVGKARNNLVMQFLARNAKALFFIDDDQGWNHEAFLRMVLDPHEIVAAAVPKKMEPLTFNNVDLVTDEGHNCEIEGGLMRVRTVGTGFMRIKRSAIEKYISAYPEMYIPGDGSQPLHHRVFEPGGSILPAVAGQKHGQFWGEDLVFCKNWEKIGGTIWIEPNVDFKHIGRNAWSGNFLKYLQANCKVQLVGEQKAA